MAVLDPPSGWLRNRSTSAEGVFKVRKDIESVKRLQFQ